MSKTFDATIKNLVEAYPADWLALAGLPAAEKVEVVDADLSALSPAADKVIKVAAPEPYVAHLEFQSSADSGFDARMLLYNVLLRSRHKLPVRSVAILLRPQAKGSGTTGAFVENVAADDRLEFRYRIVRIWEQPVPSLLCGGVGTLPLAPIANVSKAELPAVVSQMQDCLKRSANAAQAAEAWTATLILMGLKYSREFAEHLLEGVRQMEDSVTYQAILEKGVVKGEQQGKVREARSIALKLGRRRFGPPPTEIQAAFDRITDLARLETLSERVLDVSSWEEVLGDDPSIGK